MKGYLRSRTTELATAATRASTDPLADWSLRKIRLEGRPFSFAGHEYLRTLYDDTAQHVVLSKAAQIGGTTWAILRSLHACLSGLNVIYFFPTRTDVIEFSKSRVNPLLADNDFLQRAIQETNTAGLKRIGEAHLYMRGMQSPVGMKSVPADMLVFDELDETTPDAKALARERLSHSDYRRMVQLSNPSLPGYGIDEVYQQSDQRHWTLKCPGCGAWTALERAFPTKLGEEVPFILPRPEGGFYLACLKCQVELDVAAGEWVADFPDRHIHGYRISQLFSSKIDPGEILKEYRTTRFPDRFYNLKIGIPWADRQRRLDEMAVLDLCGGAPMVEESTDYCSMGIDTGKQFHVVVLQGGNSKSEKFHVIHIGVYHDFSDLDDLMKRFRVDRCVIDGMPETHATREFANRHTSKVYLSFFNEHQRGEMNWKEEAGTVQSNRTEALDASRAAIREEKVVLPRRQPIVEEFAHHLTADAKILDENEETGAKKYRYIRTGENHFSLAFTYAWMAASSFTGWRGIMRYMEQEVKKVRKNPPASHRVRL